MSGASTASRELARIGAENAESAFSLLVDRTIEMGEMVVGRPPPEGAPTPAEWDCGVMFELEGGLEAWVALLFRASQRDALVECMLGGQARSMGEIAIESALMEIANIVASHVASGIAEALGQRLIPSVPMLAANDAAAQLEALLRERGASLERCHCELSDDSGELGGLLVLVASARGGVSPLR
ncbi:MAG: chemotaxis protein CheC [Myxococcota bacterium]|nr:chemotaxis protein CheC [Myxococcota bacterium]